MMLDRQRGSVEEGRVEGGRVDEGNERGRDGTWTAGGRKRGEEGLSEEGQGRETSKGGSLYTVYSQKIPQRGHCH